MVMERTISTEDIVLSIPSEDRYIYLLDLMVCHIAKEMGFDKETKTR